MTLRLFCSTFKYPYQHHYTLNCTQEEVTSKLIIRALHVIITVTLPNKQEEEPEGEITGALHTLNYLTKETRTITGRRFIMHYSVLLINQEYMCTRLEGQGRNAGPTISTCLTLASLAITSSWFALLSHRWRCFVYTSIPFSVMPRTPATQGRRERRVTKQGMARTER